MIQKGTRMFFLSTLKTWLCAALLLAMLFPAGALAQPKLVIPESEFNFGYVPQAAQVTHVFWLYSKGTDTLRILKVNPG